jgi:hypothetical protein
MFEPQPLVVLDDVDRDLAALRISRAQAAATDKLIYQPAGWPPRRVAPEEYLLFFGFPATERVAETKTFYSFALAMIGEASNGVEGPGRFGIQFEREHWMTNAYGGTPTLGHELGGMSGGPIFRRVDREVELVGVITDHHESYDIMLAAGLDVVTKERLRGAPGNTVGL